MLVVIRKRQDGQRNGGVLTMSSLKGFESCVLVTMVGVTR